jgi:O-antigen/teichoic acid export membrane protein
MLKEILGTIGTRYIIALLNLALIFINARVLGIEGVGTIGLIWASISINVTVNSIFSGSAIVYFIHKYPFHTLFPIAVAWTFLGSGLGCGALSLLGLLPVGYAFDVYGLTVLYSLVIAHSRFLLGEDRIRGFNLTNMLQGGLLFFFLLFFYYAVNKREVSAYIWGMYLTNGVAFVVSLVMLLPYIYRKEAPSEKTFFSIIKEMLAYGLWGSADNIAETCTTRLNYFFVERFIGLGGVGLLDAGTRISESVWNISRGTAYIEYSRIAKTGDKVEQKRITLQLLKLTFLAVTAVTVCILLIPERVYTDYLFNADFRGIRGVIAALAAGIVMLGCNTILSHYFIGSGNIRFSTASSCIGLGVLLFAGFLLIPSFGLIGSALSSSIAFSVMFIFSLSQFIRLTGCSRRDFLLTKADFRLS